MRNKIFKNDWWLILFLAGLTLIIHLLTLNMYELHRDALLYYSLGQHPAWGYTSVPPLAPLFARSGTWLFGNTAIALRIFPAINASLAVIVISLIVKELKGGKFAILMAGLAYITSVAFLRSGTLFQPVSFNQFFWLLSGYLLVRMINRQNPRLWLWIFIVWGIAFLNKYSIAFFIAGALPGLLISRQRKLFLSRYFLIGSIISLLIILPNLTWQFQHNWPVVNHMAELQQTQLVNVTVFNFMMDQLLMNLPAVIIWLAGLIMLLIGKKHEEFRAIAFLYLIVMLQLLLLRGKSYYTLGLYPVLFAFGAVVVEKHFNKTFRALTFIFMILVSVPMIPIGLPVLNHADMAAYTAPIAMSVNRWEDGKIHNIPQDYADMTGWKELADNVGKFYSQLPDSVKSNCGIYAENYGQAGALLFYGKKYDLPDPVSFGDNFLLWAPDSLHLSSLIYVNSEIGDINKLFKSYKEVYRISNPYFRENGLKIFYCTEPSEKLPVFYSAKVKKLKSTYRR
jgi:hypothetical protein